MKNTEHKSNTAQEIKDLWQTPKFIFDYYDRKSKFVRDVAASKANRLCDQYYSEKHNALEQNWSKVNWCNPPYSNITPWVSKAIHEMHQGRKTVILIPADTSVKWFKLAFENCSRCDFISGRLAFIDAETQKPVSGNNKGSVVFTFEPNTNKRQVVSLIDRDSMK